MVRPRPVPPNRRVVESVGLLERLEDRLLLVAGDAHATVADEVVQIHVVRRQGSLLDLDENLAALRELDRVAHKVDEHLPQAARIADGHIRHVRQHVTDQFEFLLLCAQRERFQQLGEVIADRERNLFQLELPHLDLREVENVVEDAQQRVRRALHHRQILALFEREARVERELGHADDAVERRADLVAHVGQELALGLVGLFGHACRGDEFHRAIPNLAIEIFGQRAQFGIEALALDERLFELAVRFGQARAHAVDVPEQRGDLRRRILRQRRLCVAAVGRNVAHDADDFLERPRDPA